MTKTYPARRNVNLIKTACIMILASIGFQHFAVAQSASSSNEISADLKSLLEFYEQKIYFTENRGQWPADVKFRADFPLGQAVATSEGMMVGSYDHVGMAKRHEQGMRQEQAQHDALPFNEESVKVKGHGWMLKFQNHSPAMKIESKSKHNDVFNYFSKNSNSSQTDVANYQEVWYNNVYDKVDVRYYPSAEGSLEYDMICKPGFNKESIVLEFDGISKVTRKSNGSLVLETSVGEMVLPAPVAYQKINGEKRMVTSSYIVTGKNTVKFEIGQFDPSQTLIIDPIALRWATWINSGSSGDNHGHCIWVDASDGAIYVVARVVGTTDNITVGAFDVSANGNLETIIGKYYQPTTIGGAGTRSWQTYIGGSNDDNPYAMEQGPDGHLYITGQTGSTNFPLIGGSAFSGSSHNNSSQTGDDIFVMKINQAGNSMKAAVVGGDGTDNSYDLRINANGDIFVCGTTTSDNLASLYTAPAGHSLAASSGNDVLIFKIKQDLSAVEWMRNYGGTQTDQAMIMQMNTTNGDIYIGGYTLSNNFPTTSGAREATRSGSNRNGFIQKLKSTGSTVWSTYFNSSSSLTTSILCMEFNTTKNRLYFGGITTGLSSSNLSAAVAGQAFPDVTYNNGINDFFAACIDTAGQNFIGGTYIGGSLNEVNMMGLNVDLNNDVYIFGYTNSTDFPVSANAVQPTNLGTNDKVFLKLSSTFNSLLASTYYGGTADDYDPVGERGIKFSDCRIYTIVTARSHDIPLTRGALDTTRTSSTSIYEPGLVIWANPPDLNNNTLTGNQEVCAGGAPVNINGSVPSYVLPTIHRNGTNTAYPSLGVSITYQWQSSTDSVNWTNISGATGQNLTAAQVGPLFTKTFFRRVIGGDACVIQGATDQIITVKVIKITGTVTNATCGGSATGSIAAIATNGTAPYSYSWSNGQTTATAVNLAAGNYTLTVSDGAGCSNTANYTVTEPGVLSVTCNPANKCVNSNASISTSVSGGTGPYTYAWSNGSNASSVSGLAAGNYSVIVTDSKGCTATCSVTIGVPVVTCNKTDVLCRGGNTGTASVSASGGASPFTYLWSNGATTSSISGLVAGTYSVTVTGTNGCTATCSATVGQPANPLSATCTKVDVLCKGNSTGSVTVAPSGGTSPYTYVWSPGGATTATLGGRAAGTYSVTVTDANGCITTCSSTVTEPTNSLSATCTKVDVLCKGNSTGSVTVAPSGGTGPYTYLWSPGGATTATVTGRAAGTYTVTVKDANNCTTTCSSTVNEPTNSLSATCTKVDVLCKGNSTGSVTVAPSGGTAPYTYVWSPGGATTSTVTGRPAGTYTVTVKDANNCTTTCSSTVNEPVNPLAATCTKVDVLCKGNSSGSVTVAPSGGTGPYTYLWSPGGATTSTVTGRAAGTYSVTVTDANNCTTTCSSTVNEPVNPLAATCTKVDVLCKGNSSGSVTVAPSGGTGPYTYLWSPGGATTSTVTGRAAGTYTVTVTDANNCTTSCSSTVTEPTNALSATCTKVDVLCKGNSTGSVTVAPSGGTGPYTYVWSPGGATTSTVTGRPAGTYTVTVTDSHNCTTTCSSTVTEPSAPLSATCTKVDVLCKGNSTGSVTVAPSGGTGPYTYLWSPGGATTATVTGRAAGTYSVTVTDANGCTTTCSSTVTEPTNALSATCTKVDVLCKGNSTGSVTVTPSGGTGPYTYLWSPGGATTATVTGRAAGTYTVTVTDSHNCTTTCSSTVTEPTNALSATCTKVDVLCKGNSTGSVTVTPSGGTGPYTYVWSPGGATTASVANRPAGTYTVTVTDSHNCTTTCSSTVNEPAAPLSGNVTSTVATCTQSNSTATPHISGGTTPYSYAWSNGQTGATATGYAAGNYSVVVTDANNCTFTVNFTVAKTNCPPVAVDDYAVTPEDVPVTVTVVSNDTDVDGNIDPSTVTILTNPTNGTVVLNPNGTVTYTPFSHYVGPDQFNYQVCDDGTPLPRQCDQATVFITVLGTPTLIIDSIPEDSLITICMDDYVNLQGGISSISICGMPSNGTFTLNGICATYTPTANWNGTDNMCIISCNAANFCDTTPIIIVVIPVNDPPIAIDDFGTTQEDVPVTVTVVTNDTDIDGNIDPNTVVVVSNPSNGTTVVNPDGTITYTPFSHFVGHDHFVYNVCDDGTPLPALCDTASVFITVTGVPTIIIDSIPEDSLITLCMDDYVNIQNGISSISICGMPQNGTFTLNGICATYTPTANWNGTDTMCIISCNAGNVCDTTPIIIIVIPVNDPPIANDDFESTQEDVPVTVTVVTNDTDIDGNIDPNTVAVVSNPSNGTVAVNPDGTITYTPFSHFIGFDHFVYNVCDDGTPLPALCDTASVFITVTGVPTIIIDSIPEDSLITLCMDDYVNIQNGISSISICGMPQNGTFTLNGICATYTPTANWNGTDTMCIISCNAGNVCDTTPIIIIVIPVNDPPIAVDDSLTTNEDTPGTVVVVTNDTDIDGNIDPNTVVIITPPVNGTAVVNPDGSITYTPNSHYHGQDSLVYQVCDDGTPLPALCDQANVYITVVPVNLPPLAIDDINNTLINIPVSGNVLTNDTDPDGDNITVTGVVTPPSNGTVVLNPDGSYTYTPNTDFTGDDQFSYSVCDDGIPGPLCDTAVVYIVVVPVTVDNNPPVANPDNAVTLVNVPVFGNVLVNDGDPDGDNIILNLTPISNPSNGSVILSPDGTFAYTPNTNFVGVDVFVYEICDDGVPSLCDQTTVTITVLDDPNGPDNDPPFAADDAYLTPENVAVTGNVLTNDFDPNGDPITINTTPVVGTVNGTVVINPDGSFTYTPNTDYIGPDQFVYQICDNGGASGVVLCAMGTAYITVYPVNLPPVAIDDINNTLINTPVSGNVLTNDFDQDGDNIAVTINTNPSNGSVTVNPDGSYTYIPNTDYTGEDTFTYTICDDGNPGPMCDVATVTIHIIPVTIDNNPPIANPDNAVTMVNVPVGGNVLINDDDPDGDNIILNTTPISGPSNGSVVLNPDGTFMYTPNVDFVGVDVFVYEICDDGVPSLCDQTTVTITVLDNPNGPDNDPPFAADDAYLTPENVPVSGNVLVNDFDPNGDPITINTTPVVGTVNGTVVINPDGSFTYTPNTDYIGPDQFVYEICDDGGASGVVLCAQGTAYITVYPVNLPPVAVDDINNTLVNTPVSGNVLTNDFDQDGDNIAVTVNTNPSNGSVVVNADGTYTYTPNTGYTGEDTFTYTICDDGNPGPLCDVATVTIHIIEVTSDNNPPIANPDNAVTLINVPVGGNVLVNDGDPDGDNIILNTTPISDPSNGSVVLNPDGSYIYTPNTDFVGVDVFVYEICDDGVPSMCDQTTVTITVLDNPNGPDNDPPFAADDAYLTPVNTPVSGNVLLNDFDPNGDPITINTTPVTGPQHGTVVVNSDGTFTYTPDNNYIGPDNFVYEICDDGGASGVVLCAQGTAYITVYPTMNIILDPIDASCYGYSDGSVMLTILNGVAPYTYLWSNGATTEDLTGVPAGVYSVTVSDAFGLVVSGSATVGEPAEIIVTIDPNGPTTFCQGGSVTLTATSTSTGTYLWSNGATTQSITVSDPGVYSVTLTDAGGCSGTSSDVQVFVNPNPTPVVTAGGPTTFCNGGSVVLTSTPATTYVWAPNGEITQSITVTASGIYSVWVMDANGCEGTSAPVNVVVNSNPAPVVTASGPTTFCQGGSVTLTSAATNVASYLWAPNGETTANIVVSAAGTYSVTITDNNGCVGTSNPVTVIVNQNPTPVVTPSGPTTFCEGGSVDLTASAAASYVWSPNGETTQTITVTASGSYSVAVLDANGCSGASAPVSVVVNPNPTPTITAGGPTTFCAGGSVVLTSSAADMYVWAPGGETTQAITVTVSGDYNVWVMDVNGCEGTSADVTVTINSNPAPVVDVDGPTTFCEGESVMLTSSSATGNVWSPNGETTSSIIVENAGSYFTTVTDANGCVGISDTIVVTVNANPVPTVTPDGPTTFCDGGSVTLTASAADGYLWAPNGETTPAITVSDAGTYYVTVFDANGCRGTSAPVVVVENNNPTPTITPDGPTTFCAGGSVTLTASQAANYLWSPNGETTQSITVSATGDYSVTVTDANGCSGASAPIHVQVAGTLTVTVTASGPTELCEGQSVTLTANAANAATYQWYQNGAAIPGATGPSITVSDFADYHVVVSDQGGCTGTSNIVLVKVGEIPDAYAGLDEFVCPGESITLTATGGQNFLWSNGETTQSITVSPDQATDYIVSVSNPFCGLVDADTVNVSIAELPVAEIHASDDPSLGNPVNFTDVSGDNSIVSWFWDFGDGTSAITQNTHHTYDTEGNFTVVLTVENQYGCSASDTVNVDVKQIILIPNIITPNGDGINDAMGVKNNGVDDYGITIFNRWGQIVYEREARELNWDGRTNSGVALESGTYFYVLKVKNTGSLGSWEQTGFVTLVR